MSRVTRRTILAALYAALITGIVFVADHPRYHTAFAPIRALPAGDKICHFLLMGTMAFLANLALHCRTVCFRSGAWRWRGVLLGSAIVLTLVTLEEFSQIFIRYRSFDLVDLTFDYAGIYLIGRAAALVEKKRHQPGE